MEASALAMHASMYAADPPIVYFSPATVAAMEAVRELRASGVPAFFTMDAGPHVKVVTSPDHADRVATRLAETPGVLNVIRCGPGGDATVSGEEQGAA
jgi:diphosphomevalonate decarboxylase